MLPAHARIYNSRSFRYNRRKYSHLVMMTGEREEDAERPNTHHFHVRRVSVDEYLSNLHHRRRHEVAVYVQSFSNVVSFFFSVIHGNTPDANC